MSDNVLRCDGRDSERCACCPADDPAQPDVCWLKAPLSAMTAAELVERLAGYERATFSHTTAHGPQPVFADGIRNGKRQGWVEERSEEEHWLVNLFGEGRLVAGIGQAPTLAEALEDALRKAEGERDA